MTTEVLEKTIVPNESKILSVTESVTDSQKVSPVAKQINVTTCCQCGRVIGYEDYLVWYTPNSPINGRRHRQAAIVCIDCYHPDYSENPKICVFCGRPFYAYCTGNGKNRRYCTDRCHAADVKQQRSKIPKVDKTHICVCHSCGHEFKSIRSDSSYCSNACRQKVYRQKSEVSK